MPLDAICLAGLTAELHEKIAGGRIDKVQQPAKDLLLIALRSKSENHKLLFSIGTGNARVHLTRTSFENPSEAPMFCMLMRKHLIGARIDAVRQIPNERILEFTLHAHDELGIESEKKLIAELIGRSANLILIDSDGRIIDCMHRMDFAGDPLRKMLPGMLYRLPPKQNKNALLDSTSSEREAIIASVDKCLSMDKWLLDTFSGLSPLICRELAVRCAGSYELLSELLDSFCDSVKAGELRPYMLLNGQEPFDVSFMSITQYGEKASCVPFESFSELLDSFFSQRDKHEQQRRRSHELVKTLRTLQSRQQRKLALQAEELKHTEDRDGIRKNAELITANMYRLKKGDRYLECEDYYSEPQAIIRIPLDPLKTPQQNAAAMFKEYNKLKAAQQHLTKLINDGEAQLDYLDSVIDLLSSAQTAQDVSDLRRELISTGYIKASKASKTDKAKPQAPLHFVSDDGLDILVGRSNVQNDELSFKLGRRTDYWLHTQKVHGSHVILRCEGTVPPDNSIMQAAIIAAYYSQGKNAGKIPVDYTMLRNVRKPSGALPGKVIYTDYSTLLVEADEALVQRLRKLK